MLFNISMATDTIIIENLDSQDTKYKPSLLDEMNNDYDNWVALVIRKEFSSKLNKELIEKLVNRDKLKGVYITINKPSNFIEKELKKFKINSDNIYFVDLISGRSKETPCPNCSFINSPSNLTMLGITFTQAAKMLQKEIAEQPIFIIVDSLNTFLVYNDEKSVKKFFHFLISKSRELGSKCILFSADTAEMKSVNTLVAGFSDRTIRFGD